ncbi:MAG: cbb3-type cytochrome c oxidase subunit I [Opitutus sp.]
MTTASNEVSEIDANARFPLSLLIASAILWLILSGVLAILNFAQNLSPSFLADCSWFTYGRLHAMQETAFIYGWVATAGFAVALWILGRLGGSPLRSLNWTVVGTIFWNLGVTIGLIGIALGDGTSISLLHLPDYVQPLLLVSFGAIAVTGVLAWTGRQHRATFAAQWYAVAALFLFPWLFSAAQAMLVWFPVRGTLQAVAAGWFLQGAWTLWIAPLALSAAYYLVPKISGRVIPAYDFASLSFWTLLVVGGWTGGRHLVGGPVPAWIATIAIVSCVMLTFHYAVTAINLRGAFGKSSISLKFIAYGVLAYVVGGFADAATAMRSVSEVTQFTWVSVAQTQLANSGAFTMIMFGAIYFLVPRIANQAWPSASLIRGHYIAALIGTTLLVGSLVVAGIVQGRDLANPATSFADLSAHVRPWLLAATASQALLVLGNIVFAIHFARVVVAKPTVTAENLFSQPPVMEASVS